MPVESELPVGDLVRVFPSVGSVHHNEALGKLLWVRVRRVLILGKSVIPENPWNEGVALILCLQVRV
jgi:hypothetical protein